MATINIQITLDNISNDIDANQLSNTLEGLLKQVSGIDNIQSTIFDTDSSSTNPILARNSLKRVK